MDRVKLERSRLTFMERIAVKDPLTRRAYKTALNNFENFCMEKYGTPDYVSKLIGQDDLVIFDFLQAWINWNSKLSPRTMLSHFGRVRRYLHHRGIKLHPQDIKEELNFKAIIEEELYSLRVEDIQNITKHMRYNHKTLFYCQASSLMRIGELVQLRKKHLILGNPNIIVKIPAAIAKFKKGRTTFFSKEASKLLKPILRKIDDEDLVFGTHQDVTLSEINIMQILRRVLDKIGMNTRYETNNRYMVNTHSFRAFGITKLSRHDPNLAKKLAGQKGYLLQYDRMTDEEKLELYEKYESDLTIDTIEKQRAEIKKLKEEKAQWEKEKNAETQAIVEKVKAEILKDINSNREALHPLDELKRMKKMWDKAKKDTENPP